MWVFTTIGFFSFVGEHADPGNPGAGTVRDANGNVETIIVRARLKSHLVALKKVCANLLTEDRGDFSIIGGCGTDYPYRIKMPQALFPQVMALLASRVEYDNFKGAVPAGEYHDSLMGVWSCMRRLEATEPQAKKGRKPH